MPYRNQVPSSSTDSLLARPARPPSSLVVGRPSRDGLAAGVCGWAGQQRHELVCVEHADCTLDLMRAHEQLTRPRWTSSLTNFSLPLHSTDRSNSALSTPTRLSSTRSTTPTASLAPARPARSIPLLLRLARPAYLTSHSARASPSSLLRFCFTRRYRPSAASGEPDFPFDRFRPLPSSPRKTSCGKR
ncbi:hypothetical protein AAT19DRAFT_12457 [Rhodotorula toruloides]|uniref:Uncharacterized protein n=1 Tax=Rhodotorula toruloides TaxID=5286 RepID=A0A2T0AGA1_RHOTO|nr:hypothetical protein AAT19DRAFT_12457 [Rhodotorula toruloides]